jgi:hypothetical protein
MLTHFNLQMGKMEANCRLFCCRGAKYLTIKMNFCVGLSLLCREKSYLMCKILVLSTNEQNAQCSADDHWEITHLVGCTYFAFC